MKFWRALGYLINKLWLLLAILVVTLAVLFSVARLTLPHLDHFRADIESWVERSYGQQVSIGGLDANWSTRGPALVLERLAVLTEADVPVNFEIGRTELRVSFWSSLLEREWVFETFVLDDVVIDFYASGNGRLPDQPLIDAIEQLLLRQLTHFQVRNSEVRIHTQDGLTRTILVDNLRWLNREGKRQAIGQLQVPDVTANHLNFIADLSNTTMNELSGNLYLEASRLDISPWLEQITTTAQIERAEFNVRGWLDFEGGQFVNGQAHFDENFLEWRRAGEQHRLSTSPTTWLLKPQEGGWLMNSMPIRIDIDGMEWPVAGVRWEYEQGRHRWNLDNVRILDMGPVWSLFGSPGEEVRSWSAGLQPQGTLEAFEVQLDSAGELQFYVAANDLSWQPYSGIPGVSGLGFEMWSDRSGGRFEVSGEEVSLYSPRTYTDAQQLSELYWQGVWERSPNGWTIRMPEARFSLPDAVVVQKFRLDGGPDQSPSLEWSIADGGSAMDAFDALALIPLQLGEDLADYLLESVQGGEISALNMVWRGRLADFPYSAGEGVFQARTEVTDLAFKFSQDWPALQAERAIIYYHNDTLRIESDSAEVAGVKASALSAEFPALLDADRWLHIRAETRSEAAPVKALFDASPLADSVGAALAQVTTEGPVAAQFQIDIPLFAEGDLRAFGEVQLERQSVLIDAIDTRFDQVTGVLAFDNADLSFTSQRAFYRGIPLQLTLKGGFANYQNQNQEQEQETAYRLAIDFSSETRSTVVQRGFGDIDWLKQLEGELAARGNFTLWLPEQGYHYDGYMRADLTPVRSNLPIPLSKAPGEIWFWDTRIDGNEEGLTLSTGVNHQFLMKGYLPLGSTEFSQVLLSLGRATDSPPELAAGTHIYANVPNFDWNDWREHLDFNRSDGSQASSSPFSFPALKRIQGDVARVRFLGQEFTDVKGDLEHRAYQVTGDERDMTGWYGEINAAQTRLVIDRATYTDAMRVTADFLDLGRFETDDLTAQEDDLPETSEDLETAELGLPENNWLARLPALELICRICRYDGRDLGRVTLGLDPSRERDQLRHIRLLRAGTRLELTGGWDTDEQGVHSYLRGQFNSNNISALMQEWGFDSVVRDSSANVQAELAWRGALDEFNVDFLDGTVTSALGAGYLRDVSDGGARLFSVLSLDSLVRKLTLDFRDIFARGMFFSSFNGEFDIDQGVVSTQNTQMIGSAGDLSIRGTTNLVDQTLNYQLTYTPKVTSSLPVLLAWMVNPPSGLAALVIDRMLFDAKVISRLQYQVVGTIDNPQISEIQRDARDVEIPEEDLLRIQEHLPVEDEPIDAVDEPEQGG